jgi:hypothetical protein
MAYTANAEHHRDHAINILNGSNSTLRLVETQVKQFYASGTYSAEDDKNLRIILRLIVRALDQSSAARTILLDEKGDLDTARRLLSQPKYSGVSFSSTLRGLRVANLVGIRPDAPYELNQIMRNLTNIQFSLERAMWHTQDAIREEVYQDPKFEQMEPLEPVVTQLQLNQLFNNIEERAVARLER